MAQLGNLLVKGSSRFLNKAYFEDINIIGNAVFGKGIIIEGELNIGENTPEDATYT